METFQTQPAASLSSPDGQQPGQSSNDEEWQGKLSSLQDEHKLESIQQQQEHLEQLKSLQTQLLREISTNINQETTPPVQDISTSKQQELKSPTKPSGKENIPSPKKHSNGQLTPTRSQQDYIPPPRTNPVVRHSPPGSVSSPPPPRTSSSPQNVSSPTQTPPYTILCPKSAWEAESQISALSVTGPWTPHSSSRGDSFSRASLVTKHNRHVDDLKKYYESELLELRTQLEQMGPGRTIKAGL